MKHIIDTNLKHAGVMLEDILVVHLLKEYQPKIAQFQNSKDYQRFEFKADFDEAFLRSFEREHDRYFNGSVSILPANMITEEL